MNKHLLQQAVEEIERLQEELRQIGDAAHDASSGPAVWDKYWDIRNTAYNAMDSATLTALREARDAQPAAGELTDVPPYYEAMEAMRRGLNELPRYSFLLDEKGNVRRAPDRTGRWIEWQSAHELFDPVVVDALIAKMRTSDAIKNAARNAK